MSDENDDVYEKIGDENTPEYLAEMFTHSSDLELGYIAGMADAAGKLLCGGVQETKGETDGTCKVFDAAVNEYHQRSDKGHQR